MADEGEDQDQTLSYAHRLPADLSEIQKVESTILRAIYNMLGTMYPGNFVRKGGGCDHLQCTAQESNWEGYHFRQEWE